MFPVVTMETNLKIQLLPISIEIQLLPINLKIQLLPISIKIQLLPISIKTPALVLVVVGMGIAKSTINLDKRVVFVRKGMMLMV